MEMDSDRSPKIYERGEVKVKSLELSKMKIVAFLY